MTKVMLWALIIIHGAPLVNEQHVKNGLFSYHPRTGLPVLERARPGVLSLITGQHFPNIPGCEVVAMGPT